MGIKGLLPLLSPITRPRHLREFSGLRAGIDGHVWLHRSMFANARAFAVGKYVDSHLKYFSRKCEYLLNFGIQPIIIFDGSILPAKLQTRSLRDFDRAISMGRAIGLQDSGNPGIAYNEFAKAAEIKHEMVQEIISSVKTLGAEAYVSPYEADAQLSHLSQLGLIDFAVSEDSDLLVYGCHRVLFKLDYNTGYSMEVASPIHSAPLFSKLCPLSVTLACILAGCDYGPVVSGIGIKKAIEIAEYCKPFVDDPRILAKQTVQALNRRGVAFTDASYLEQRIRISALVFRHQAVFNPLEQRMQYLSPIESLGITPFEANMVGRIHSSTLARDIYLNLAHPSSRYGLNSGDGTFEDKPIYIRNIVGTPVIIPNHLYIS